MRCACGIAYHTNDAYLGRLLSCSCGRTVTIVRPPGDNAAPGTTPPRAPEQSRNRRVRRVRHRDSDTSAGAGRATATKWRRRRHTISVALANIVRPLVSGTWLVRATAMAAWLYLAAMVVAWILQNYTSERTIAGTIIAYGPRWLSLWPLAVLVPVALLVVRPALWPLLLAAWIGLVPVMGARVSLSTLFSGELPATPPPGTFRVITFNVLRGQALAAELPDFLRTLAPDVVMLQECGEDLWQAFQKQRGWYSVRHGTLCTASHWPIGQMDIMPREEVVAMRGSGLVMRAFVESPHGPLAVVNLHLATARHGLEGMLGDEGLVPDNPFGTSNDTHQEPTPSARENESRFARNVAVRDRESALASTFALATRSSLPLVIGGDFNLPVESTIFQRYWSGFTDAFEARGNGLGWSKREGRWLRIRIDHLLTLDGGPTPVRIVVGADYMSDHRPVIVDMAWPEPAVRQ